jgi:hypothetical protein
VIIVLVEVDWTTNPRLILMVPSTEHQGKEVGAAWRETMPASQPIFAAAGAISNAGEALRIETEALLHAISVIEQVWVLEDQSLPQIVKSGSKL